MALHLTDHRDGFGSGLTEITRIGEEKDDTGIGFGILKLDAGATLEETAERETAWLLLDGRLDLRVDGDEARWSRRSLFDDLPHCLHTGAGATVQMRCADAVELAVFRTANRATLPTRLYAPGDVRDEARGMGQVHNAALRFVRTIFDDSNADPNAELVLGEVITLPGRWSSYPPHHHPQPEIYHYRFSRPEGYGHAELGDHVLKVRHNDTVKIFAGNDHAQAAAPGYGMYYIWVIRHLPGNRYDVPTFTAEHAWTMRDNAEVWWPAGVADDD